MSAAARMEAATSNLPLPLLAVAVSVVTWGVASPLIKVADIGGPALSFYRLWIGAALLLGALRWSRGGWARSLRWALPAGVIFGLNMLLFVVAVKTTTVANATLIGALQPAIVLLVAGRWFGESVTRREVACVAAAIAGVAIVIAGSAGAPEWDPLGDALAVCAVLSFTVYFLVSKRARTAEVGTLEYMAVVHLAAALIVTPVALAEPRELWHLDATDMLVVAFFALVSGTGGQMLIGWAHRYVDVSVSSLMMLGVPVVAAASAWLLVDEALGPLQAAGGAITLAAIAVMVRRPAEMADAAHDAAHDAAREETPLAVAGQSSTAR